MRLAEEGADVIAIDVAAQISTVPYPMATIKDLEETALLVNEAGRRCVVVRADVRDIHTLASGADRGAKELGGIDIVIANAGILPFAPGPESLDEAASSWTDAIGVMLTGVFNTVRVTQERLISQGRGGSIVIISSTAGLKGAAGESGGIAGYTAAKHGVVGLMRGYAKLLGPHSNSCEHGASQRRGNANDPSMKRSARVLGQQRVNERPRWQAASRKRA